MRLPMRLPLLLAAIPMTLLTGCVAPTGPVEVTRFHLPDVAMLGRGTIAVEPAAGMDGQSLELRSFEYAVGRELQRVGYQESSAGAGAQVAEVRLTRHTAQPERRSGPVSVGVGGSTGSYGSGVGLGIGLNLAGRPAAQTETLLGVVIRERATGKVIWEGRAQFTVRADSPLAQTQLAASETARALFQGFPGNSGETILVKPAS